MKYTKILFFLLIILLSGCKNKQVAWIANPPAGSEFCTINKEGTTVIPNGRYITPAGTSFVVAPHPFGLTLSSDANIAVTANSGTSPLSITILKNIMDQTPEIIQIPPGAQTDDGVLASVFMGLAISPDNKVV